MLYYDHVHDFSEEELNTATLVGQYVAFGLDRAHADVASRQLFERERAARRDAEAANRAKDEFLATVAHELRNPLGAVVNAVQHPGPHTATDDPMPGDGPSRGSIVSDRSPRPAASTTSSMPARFHPGGPYRAPEASPGRSPRGPHRPIPWNSNPHRIPTGEARLGTWPSPFRPSLIIVLVLTPIRLQQASGTARQRQQVHAGRRSRSSLDVWPRRGIRAPPAASSDNGSGDPAGQDGPPSSICSLQANPTLGLRTSGGLGIGLSPGQADRGAPYRNRRKSGRGGGRASEFTMRLLHHL